MTDYLRNLLGRDYDAQMLANAVACDYLRKMNVMERQPFLREVGNIRPDVAIVCRETYPQHCS